MISDLILWIDCKIMLEINGDGSGASLPGEGENGVEVGVECPGDVVCHLPDGSGRVEV